MKVLKKLIKHKFITFILVIHSLISTIALIYIFDNWKLWSMSYSVQNLMRSPRILCFVATYEKNHQKNVRAIKDTWGSRCDILYFASSVTDPSLPSFTVNCTKHDHDHLWCKTQKGIIYGADTYQSGWDWMLKADDDTYVIMDNLKYLLSQHDPNEAIWFGCQFALGGDPNKKYMSGGAGYALSRRAALQLSQEFKHFDKCKDLNTGEKGAEDAEVGHCLRKLGAKLGDSRDESQRNRFFPFSPDYFVDPNANLKKTLNWWGVYNVFDNQKGFNCCSNTTITFHYIKPIDMYVFDFFLYHMSVHKRQ